MAVPESSPPACVKCGSVDVRRHYARAGNTALHTRADEHLDHWCRACGYEWEGDCLDARLPQQDLSVGGS